jgi:thioredoxin reductase
VQHDVIVVGGSYAGMAAALQLARAHRSVLIIDAGLRRNRLASHSHGFLTQDGIDPADIARSARRQLDAYPTLRRVDDEAAAIEGESDDFTVVMADGTKHHGRRILLATGVIDRLPPVDGLADRWGRSVFHCPYCHGYELRRGLVGVIATGPMSTHQAELLTEWGTVTFLLNDSLTLDADAREALGVRGAVIEDTPIARIEAEADVHLVDGRVLPFAGIFVATHVEPSGPLVEAVGCALEETPMGLTIKTGPGKETSIPGIYACGDLHMPLSVSFAVGDGAMAGMQVHRSLVWPAA